MQSLPSVIDQRNARILFVESKAIFHFDTVCSIGLSEFSFNCIFSSINGFSNSSLIFQEFQDNNGVFIAIESSLTTSNHIKFIVSKFECSMNPNCQLYGSLFSSLNNKIAYRKCPEYEISHASIVTVSSIKIFG